MAYWGPKLQMAIPFLTTPPPLAIDWDGRSNVESLSFSFDGFKKTQFVVLVKLDDVPIPLPIPIPDVTPLSPPLGQKDPTPLKVTPLVGLSGYTPIEAAVIALAKAADSANVISGQGTLDVLRYGSILPARTVVQVQGAGITYDGEYFVSSVTHTIKPGSYKQSFTLQRNRLIGGSAPDPSSYGLGQQLPAFSSAAGTATRRPAAGSRSPPAHRRCQARAPRSRSPPPPARRSRHRRRQRHVLAAGLAGELTEPERRNHDRHQQQQAHDDGVDRLPRAVHVGLGAGSRTAGGQAPLGQVPRHRRRQPDPRRAAPAGHRPRNRDHQLGVPSCRSPTLAGTFVRPRIGANVWVEFERGDPDKPIWVGCWWGEGQIPVMAEEYQRRTRSQRDDDRERYRGISICDVPIPAGGDTPGNVNIIAGAGAVTIALTPAA